ncbi:DUF4132 domain-containing protein [Paractinoplanes globisporus]|uniref:DUF4132 domain-containing protein n=1 Tax=Paractinoplanes globisporus TaxID=113565 RepID=A0ABW6W5F4_9ACTN|nr:DUF4132 domain-containing protein [Actinoplanes globisporus]
MPYEVTPSSTAAETATGSSSTPASRSPTPAAAASAPIASSPSFVFPPAWYRYRHPRRGSVGVAAFTPDRRARQIADDEVARVPHQVELILAATGTDPELRRAGLAWLAGDGDAPAAGAAAVALAAALGKWSELHKLAAFADRWIAARGLPFAVEAAVEAMAMRVAEDGPFVPTGRRYRVERMAPADTRGGGQIDNQLLILFRVREALAAASPDDYAAAVIALDGYRSGTLYARVATTLLAPDQAEWVEEDIAQTVATNERYLALALLTAAGTPAQLNALVPLVSSWTVVGTFPLIATLADGLGAACVPALLHWFDTAPGADGQKRLLSAIAALPSDEAMAGLIARADAKYVTPALLEAAYRFPARALRLLAEAAAAHPTPAQPAPALAQPAATQRAVADLLRGHLATHPGLAAQVLPRLTPEAAAQVEAVTEAAAAITIAPAEAIPPLLASPPWLHRPKPPKPVVVPGLTSTDRATIAWLPGEREEWLDTEIPHYGHRRDWPALALRIATGRASWYEPYQFFAEAPEVVARPVLARWKPSDTYDAGSWTRVIAARFELDALPPLLAIAGSAAAAVAPALLPYSSPEIALHMADWLARLKSVRRTALTWLLRHPAEATRALVPPALGKAGPARRQAERALLALHTNGHTEAVRAAARSHGVDAEAAIDTLLATDPLAVLPARIPANPPWAVPALLPPIALRDGVGALPPEAVAHVVTMLALSRPDDPYAGVEVVRQACDPASLAEFGWALFQRWLSSGADPKENWALDALGLIGDDRTVRRLTPQIVAWPREGAQARAATGVQVLAAIGSDVALMHLHGIAERARLGGLKKAAQRKMDEVAAGLGLTADQLADRLVPGLGLEPDGSMRLDYGPRQFVVGFDKQLRPFAADATGNRLKALPKPGVRDDPERAPAAYREFTTLKKDVRTVAADQIRRLERAMVTGRRWPSDEFRRLFVEHPLLRHIVRRLVWAVYDESGALPRAFRLADERPPAHGGGRLFATVDDDEATLAGDATVGVAHPLHLGDSLPAWSKLFAAREILQPFPQLARQTFALTPDEAASSTLDRFRGQIVPTTSLLGLERRGWRREDPQDGGLQEHLSLPLGPKLELAIELEPGIVPGMPAHEPEQKLMAVFLHNGTGTTRAQPRAVAPPPEPPGPGHRLRSPPRPHRNHRRRLRARGAGGPPSVDG